MKSFAAFFLLVALLLEGGCARKTELGWMSDLAVAQVKAAQEGKYLLVDFTGSTWCPPCKQLDRAVFASAEFAAFARKAVLVELDFPPAGKRTPEKLAVDPKLAALMAKMSEYGVAAFPTVILFGPEHDEIGRVLGYRGEAPGDYLRRLGAPVAQPPM